MVIHQDIYDNLSFKFREHFSDEKTQEEINRILFEELIGVPKTQSYIPNLDSLYHEVLTLFRIPMVKKQSGNRERNTVAVRSLFWYLARRYFGGRYSLVTIGKYLRYDHTTVIHAIKSIDEKLQVKDDLVTDLFQKWEEHIKIKFGNTNN